LNERNKEKKKGKEKTLEQKLTQKFLMKKKSPKFFQDKFRKKGFLFENIFLAFSLFFQ